MKQKSEEVVHMKKEIFLAYFFVKIENGYRCSSVTA